MTVEIVTPAPRDAWAQLAAADPDVLVTQTPAWTDCLCAVTGARDVSRLYDFGSGRRLVLPLVRPRRRPGFEASFPPAWGFGGLVGPAARTEEVSAVLTDLRRSGVVSVRVAYTRSEARPSRLPATAATRALERPSAKQRARK